MSSRPPWQIPPWLEALSSDLVVTHAMLRRLTSWRCIIIIILVHLVATLTGYVDIPLNRTVFLESIVQ